MAERMIAARTYCIVCALLVLLTFLTVGVSFLRLAGTWHIVIGLAIALCKASLVVLFFLHVLVSPRLTWIVIAVACFWVGILTALQGTPIQHSCALFARFDRQSEETFALLLFLDATGSRLEEVASCHHADHLARVVRRYHRQPADARRHSLRRGSAHLPRERSRPWNAVPTDAIRAEPRHQPDYQSAEYGHADG